MRLKTSDIPPSGPKRSCEKSDTPKITAIDYDSSHYQEIEVKEVEECFVFKGTPAVTWINIDCLHQVDIIDKIGECYGFHPLVLEDILSDQRPKVEDYDDYIFIVLKMLHYKKDNGEESIESDQISLILGPNYVVSFKEKEADIFRPLRERLRTGKGKIRKLGADYLAYSMMDLVIDDYFEILEKLGERFEDLEDLIVASPEPASLSTIYNLKRDMLFLRKSVWPLREAISRLQRMDSPLISESTRIYLRDLYDHTIQVIENVEAFRDLSASLLDTYLSSLSNRLNEVMKVLTVISTIFIPLTFIVGLYGMNFKYMPELDSSWGYPSVIAFMIVVAFIMLAYFKNRKWF